MCDPSRAGERAPSGCSRASGGRARSMHREYVVRIRNARNRVDIANSYFVPDRRVRAALFHAVRSGARVRVLIPAKSDVPVVQFASEALFDTLLRHGVDLFTLPGTMLHAKTAIIDDTFTTVGSYNLDERSWRKNLEINLAVEDRSFARHVRTWFEHDLALAARVDLATWRDDRSLVAASSGPRSRCGGSGETFGRGRSPSHPPYGSDRGLRHRDGRHAARVPRAAGHRPARRSATSCGIAGWRRGPRPSSASSACGCSAAVPFRGMAAGTSSSPTIDPPPTSWCSSVPSGGGWSAGQTSRTGRSWGPRRARSGPSSSTDPTP